MNVEITIFAPTFDRALIPAVTFPFWSRVRGLDDSMASVLGCIDVDALGINRDDDCLRTKRLCDCLDCTRARWLVAVLVKCLRCIDCVTPDRHFVSSRPKVLASNLERRMKCSIGIS